MTDRQTATPAQGQIIEDGRDLTLGELCAMCQMHAEYILALVNAGIIEPAGERQTQWRFSAHTVIRVQRAHRLQQDLGVNRPGAALALDLLDEIEALKARLRRLEA